MRSEHAARCASHCSRCKQLEFAVVVTCVFGFILAAGLTNWFRDTSFFDEL